MEDPTKETKVENKENNVIDETYNKIEKETTENKQENIKKKSPKKTFVIKYIAFVMVLILLTTAACYYTIQKQNKNILLNAQEEKIEEITQEKTIAEDSIFAINSYAETYNENPIEITTKYYKNGEIYSKSPQGGCVQFIQINGLKDKSIEEKINSRFRQAAEEWNNIGTTGHSYVVGNFSNILSVEMNYYDYKENKSGLKTFNIDLNTGDDIPFEKIFVSSAPIKSMLIENLYEKLSWINKSKDDNEETWEDAYNMDNVDTSDYEDKSLLLARKYDKQKKNISYMISPTTVTIYGLMDDSIIDNSDLNNYLQIKLYKYKEEIAIYKRFLNKDNIYENNSAGMKNIIVFTAPDYYEMYKSLYYGKISDNVFLEEVETISDEKSNLAEKFIEKKSKEFKDRIVKETSKEKGVICQRICGSYWYYDYTYSGRFTNEYVVIHFQTYTATCSNKYFQEDAFRDYIKMESRAKASMDLLHFDEWQKEEFPNLTIKNEDEEYYLDKNGNIVARSHEEMQQYLKTRIEEEKRKQEIEWQQIIDEYSEVPEENYNEQPGTNSIEQENIITNIVEEDINNNEVETNTTVNNDNSSLEP